MVQLDGGRFATMTLMTSIVDYQPCTFKETIPQRADYVRTKRMLRAVDFVWQLKRNKSRVEKPSVKIALRFTQR